MKHRLFISVSRYTFELIRIEARGEIQSNVYVKLD